MIILLFVVAEYIYDYSRNVILIEKGFTDIIKNQIATEEIKKEILMQIKENILLMEFPKKYSEDHCNSSNKEAVVFSYNDDKKVINIKEKLVKPTKPAALCAYIYYDAKYFLKFKILKKGNYSIKLTFIDKTILKKEFKIE